MIRKSVQRFSKEIMLKQTAWSAISSRSKLPNDLDSQAE
jgi:hypothetical protein